MATKIELRNLIESVSRDVDPRTKMTRFGTNPFADTTGYHLYGELNLTLKLTAAEETTDAVKYIRILQEYATIGEACATESQATLLEVQGERIHFLLPRSDVDGNSITEMLRFCVAFTNAVYSRVGKIAGQDFRGFRMAVDHGRAILVSSGVQANGSIVSLGPAANAPAKEMKRNGAAGCLRMRSRHHLNSSNRVSNDSWINISLLEPSADLKSIISPELNERFLHRSEEFSGAVRSDELNVLVESAEYMKTFSGGYVNRAVKVRGFALRADLDGFSKEVEDAFQKGDIAIGSLVGRFFNIMRYPEQFRSKVGKTIDLPFAGDCATVIVLPERTGYDDAREFLPVRAASEWHSQQSGADSNKRRWADYFGQTKWAVAIAGGDEEEGAEGYILVAPIKGRNRDFLVAAGWSIGRSLDGQESDGVVGNDTVIPFVDYNALSTPDQADFEKLNSLFWISHRLNASSLRSTGAWRLASTPAVYVPHITQPVPQPRPYCE